MVVTTREKNPSVASEARTVDTRVFLTVGVLLLVAIPALSTGLSLYDRITHWGKLVHAIEGFLVALLIGLLLLGWRDRERIDLTDQLAALMTMFSGILLGVLWEIVEFVLDWLRNSDMQKSNTETMTDLLWSDVGAVVGAVLAIRLYCRWLRARDRQQVGDVAVWLVDGPSRWLDRHGFLMTVVVALIAGAAVVALWFADRPVPGFPIS